MEIITKLDRVWESSNNCPGCGAILGLKFILQSFDDLKDVILVTSPGEIAPLGRAGLRVSMLQADNPVAAARGIATARPEARVIVYASTNHIDFSSFGPENITVICYNKTLHVQGGKLKAREMAKSALGRAAYIATANVAYYEDFIAKLRKASSTTGMRFIDLLTPCPSTWNYDPSNTIEIGRMATEASLWPLYEVTNVVSVTKTPPHSETVQRYIGVIKAELPEQDMQALQEKANRNWKYLKEGKLL